MNHDIIRSLIRDVPDFPKPGILFKDITPILKDPRAMSLVIDVMERDALDLGAEVVAGPESRGFLFGMALAMRMGLGFVPIRKPKKLPWKTRGVTYALEYGTDRVEIHEDAVRPGQKVVLVDDLLATGGTMGACCELVESLGGCVAGCLFLVELAFLKGREKLPGRTLRSVVIF